MHGVAATRESLKMQYEAVYLRLSWHTNQLFPIFHLSESRKIKKIETEGREQTYISWPADPRSPSGRHMCCPSRTRRSSRTSTRESCRTRRRRMRHRRGWCSGPHSRSARRRTRTRRRGWRMRERRRGGGVRTRPQLRPGGAWRCGASVRRRCDGSGSDARCAQSTLGSVEGDGVSHGSASRGSGGSCGFVDSPICVRLRRRYVYVLV